MIFEDGIIFTKNVSLKEINNHTIFEPAIYNNDCWTITDFDFAKLKELFPDSKGSTTSELLRNLIIFNSESSKMAMYNGSNILKYLESNVNFSYLTYNFTTHQLFIIVNNTSMYIGYPNEGEIMYSNNASLLREFCPVIFKLPANSYSLNEEFYEKKDGIDLVVRSLKP